MRRMSGNGHLFVHSFFAREELIKFDHFRHKSAKRLQRAIWTSAPDKETESSTPSTVANRSPTEVIRSIVSAARHGPIPLCPEHNQTQNKGRQFIVQNE